MTANIVVNIYTQNSEGENAYTPSANGGKVSFQVVTHGMSDTYHVNEIYNTARTSKSYTFPQPDGRNIFANVIAIPAEQYIFGHAILSGSNSQTVENTYRAMGEYRVYQTNVAQQIVPGLSYTTFNIYFDLKNWVDNRETFSGTGAENNPYIIDTPGKLAQLAYNVNNGISTYSGLHFKQAADINLGGYDWVPIGDGSHVFEGIYEGQNHKIYGMHINLPNSDNVALFGATNLATIQNLTILNSYINGREHVGSFLGYGGINTFLINCSSNACVSGQAHVGGIAGYLPFGVSCVFSGMVLGTDESGYQYGGIAGNSWDLQKCINYGVVYCNGDCAGGIAGNCYRDIYNCVQQGVIYVKPTKEHYFVGLILGSFEGSSDGDAVVANCDAFGQVIVEDGAEAQKYLGAVLGAYRDQSYARIENCSATLSSNETAGQYSGGATQGSVNISGCYTQVNSAKRYSGGDFSGYSIVNNMNDGRPMQNALYSIAVGGFSSSQITSKLQSLGYTYSSN